MSEAITGNLRQQREVCAETLVRSRERRLPIIERLAISASVVDRSDQNIARPRIETCQQPLSRAPDDRHSELGLRGVQIAVASDDRRSVGGRCRLHAIKDLLCGWFSF